MINNLHLAVSKETEAEILDNLGPGRLGKNPFDDGADDHVQVATWYKSVVGEKEYTVVQTCTDWYIYGCRSAT